MSSLLIKPNLQRETGETLTITPESAGWENISMAAVRLQQDDTYDFRLNGEEAVIQSRCVDEKGQVQPTEEEFAKYWNMSRRQLYATIQSVLGHCNWIQAWRVNPNGKVTNGLPPVGAIADVHG